MDFIGRSSEIGFLESQYELDHPLTLITGRHRVGKSKLILEFIKGRNALYFSAGREKSQLILQKFSKVVSASIGSENTVFKDWETAIRAYMKFAPPGRKILAIDEFQFISMADENFVGNFQYIWDTYLSNQDVMVILCGSYLSMMRRLTTDYGSPLYGRNTGDLMLKPIRFKDTVQGKEYRRAVEEYAFTGGVPQYMRFVKPQLTVLENIIQLTMDAGAPFFNETSYLLSDEFHDPASYNTYLLTIAEGNRKADRISSAVQEPSSTVIPYLRRLISAGLLERRVPVTENPEDRSRNGIYRISDPFIALWFRFVYPYREQIQQSMPDRAIGELNAHFIDAHVSFVFEDICRTELRDYLYNKGCMAAYGSYWEKNLEIDVVALDKAHKTIYAGECKYRSAPVGPEVLSSLRTKCLKAKEFEGYKVIYCLFSVSGYTEQVELMARGEGDILFDKGIPVISPQDTS